MKEPIERSEKPPGEEEPENYRRVLFELAVDSTGAVEWRIDRTLPPIMVLSVISGLEVARKDLMFTIMDSQSEGENHEE